MSSLNIMLLANASATGNGQRWAGGRGTFSVAGTFGGATVSLQALGPDGTTWLSVGADAQLTSTGLVNFELPSVMIRAAVTGGSPSGLYAAAIHV